jgi:hypothetical protein
MEKKCGIVAKTTDSLVESGSGRLQLAPLDRGDQGGSNGGC